MLGITENYVGVKINRIKAHLTGRSQEAGKSKEAGKSGEEVSDGV